MREGTPRVYTIVIAALAATIIVAAQGNLREFTISGASGNVPVTQIKNRSYVDVESVARLANGSLSYQGNRIVLTLPTARETTSTAHTAPAKEAGLSKDFLRAGIEAMSTIREWHSALASLIENGYPMTRENLAPFQERATKNLRFAQAAATTDADHKLAQLAGNAYQKMNDLSEKYLSKRESLTYSAPNSLENDPDDQSLVACGRALGAMAANGQVTDEAACH
jgi:hypothetical protein